MIQFNHMTKPHKIWANKYFMNRYYNEPKFRRAHLDAVRKNQAKNKEKIRKQERARYANRTKKQIEKRTKYLKKLRTKSYNKIRNAKKS